MRRIAALALALFSMILAAQTAAPPAFIWFDQVTTPTSFTEAQLQELSLRLHRGLKSNLPMEQITSGLSDDPTPRVVFLTIGDDLWPGRTYFGTGLSFFDAVGKAVSILRSNEVVRREEIVKQATSIIDTAKKEHERVPQDWVDRRHAPGEWSWLKLQPVQAAKGYPNFSFVRSSFSFSALVGFSFGPRMGFAFTPDQITGRYLLTPHNFMSKRQIGNIIAESFNFEALNTWLALSNISQEQGICLFEVDTYYTDGATAVRMFRCHSLPGVPDGGSCAHAMREAAKALASRVATKSGEFKQPFPDWKQPKPNVEARDDMGELALALRGVALAEKDDALSRTAGQVLISLKNNLLEVGAQKQFWALASIEELPESSTRQPRTLAILRDNALALMALLAGLEESAVAEQGRQGESSVLAAKCKSMARFIESLDRGDGTFYNAQVIPEGLLLKAQDRDADAACLDNALAALALARAAERFGDGGMKEHSRRVVARLVQDLSKKDMKSYVPDPWIIEALTLDEAVGKPHYKVLQGLGYALMTAVMSKATAADFAGAPKAYPDYSQAARMTWGMARLARWFHGRQPQNSDALMATAALAASFQLQGQIDAATSSCLPRPRFYLGFFRDYPDDFHFTLYGNCSQVLSLLALSDVLSGCYKGVFPESQTLKEQLLLARRFLDLHPAYLTQSVVSNNKGISEESRSSIGAMENRRESKMTQAESEEYFNRGAKGKKRP